MVLSHIDDSGRARMVDVSAKDDTVREATARGRIIMEPATLELVAQGGMEKGDVLAVAQVAGVMAAKQTGQLIPMCHPLPITGVSMRFEMDRNAHAIDIEATARVVGKTGVEMEALTAVSVAALTIYDMCKAVDRAMLIDGIRLIRKSGGKSGDFVREAEA
ncbi:MAG: cyclic pyranopterin monophosphate synthase [Chloroflexota bacterium]|nr:cyclic pyranopterin monophosphate synthase [Chloroflexota bacterium]